MPSSRCPDLEWQSKPDGFIEVRSSTFRSFIRTYFKQSRKRTCQHSSLDVEAVS